MNEPVKPMKTGYIAVDVDAGHVNKIVDGCPIFHKAKYVESWILDKYPTRLTDHFYTDYKFPTGEPYDAVLPPFKIAKIEY